MEICPDEAICRLFDADGGENGPAERKFLWFGELIDIDEYASESGLVLPDSE